MPEDWPDGIVDPHIHQWDPLTTRRHTSAKAYQLRPLPRIPRSMRWLAPKADREFIGHPHAALKPYLPQDYRADTAELPVQTVVHIECDWLCIDRRDTVNETRWLTTLPCGRDGAPALGAIVVHADPRFDDAGAVGHVSCSSLRGGRQHILRIELRRLVGTGSEVDVHFYLAGSVSDREIQGVLGLLRECRIHGAVLASLLLLNAVADEDIQTAPEVCRDRTSIGANGQQQDAQGTERQDA